eukprot:5070190-Amphidinium_carterae.1
MALKAMGNLRLMRSKESYITNCRVGRVLLNQRKGIPALPFEAFVLRFVEAVHRMQANRISEEETCTSDMTVTWPTKPLPPTHCSAHESSCTRKLTCRARALA